MTVSASTTNAPTPSVSIHTKESNPQGPSTSNKNALFGFSKLRPTDSSISSTKTDSSKASFELFMQQMQRNIPDSELPADWIPLLKRNDTQSNTVNSPASMHVAKPSSQEPSTSNKNVMFGFGRLGFLKKTSEEMPLSAQMRANLDIGFNAITPEGIPPEWTALFAAADKKKEELAKAQLEEHSASSKERNATENMSITGT